MIVDLDPGEIAISKIIATMRSTVNRAASVRDQRRDAIKSGVDLDYIGAVAEIAWGKKFNRYPDLSIMPRKGSFDSVLNGKRIDIKATDRKNGRLLATTGKSTGEADIYVLAIVDGARVNFVGYAFAEELINETRITDLGHGKTYAMDQAELRRFKEDIAGESDVA